tara:strand:- start:319 stop:624 length:306 start_codon:yes stop_codon:yes gene_type:complete
VIKEIEQIKMRKDIKYYAEKYQVPLTSIAEYFDITNSSMCDFISRGKFLRTKNYNKLKNKINNFNNSFKEAEEYEPTELKLLNNHEDWVKMNNSITQNKTE